MINIHLKKDEAFHQKKILRNTSHVNHVPYNAAVFLFSCILLQI